MKLNFKWVSQTGQYSNGFNLKLNRITVASFHWNLTGGGRWIGSANLPSIKTDQIKFDTEVEMQEHLERIVINWFTEALKVYVEPLENGE